MEKNQLNNTEKLKSGDDRSSEIQELVIKKLGIDSNEVTVTKERVKNSFQYKIQIKTEDLNEKNISTALTIHGLFIHSTTTDLVYTTLYVS